MSASALFEKDEAGAGIAANQHLHAKEIVRLFRIPLGVFIHTRK